MSKTKKIKRKRPWHLFFACKVREITSQHKIFKPGEKRKVKNITCNVRNFTIGTHTG